MEFVKNKPKSYFFLLNFNFELCFHEENVLLILFNAHPYYIICIHSKHLYTDSLLWTWTFELELALGWHLEEVPIAILEGRIACRSLSSQHLAYKFQCSRWNMVILNLWNPVPPPRFDVVSSFNAITWACSNDRGSPSLYLPLGIYPIGSISAHDCMHCDVEF